MNPDDLMALTEEERQALPAVHHRPAFFGIASPPTWICAVCWGEGWTTQWPCKPATKGGVELAKSLDLDWSW